jgi:hypothetical protein
MENLAWKPRPPGQCVCRGTHEQAADVATPRPALLINVTHDSTQVAYSAVNPLWQLPAPQYTFREAIPGGGCASFVVLDTTPVATELPWHTFSVGDVDNMIAYAEQQLAAEAAHGCAWLFAVGHHPIYSGGEHGNNAFLVGRLAPLLQKYGAISLTGHDHDLEYIYRNGVNYFISGGGSTLRTIVPSYPGRQWGAATNGVLMISLTAALGTFTFTGTTGNTLYNITLPAPSRVALSTEAALAVNVVALFGGGGNSASGMDMKSDERSPDLSFIGPACCVVFRSCFSAPTLPDCIAAGPGTAGVVRVSSAGLYGDARFRSFPVPWANSNGDVKFTLGTVPLLTFATTCATDPMVAAYATAGNAYGGWTPTWSDPYAGYMHTYTHQVGGALRALVGWHRDFCYVSLR